MTKLQKMQRKYGNAMRAFKGNWCMKPQPTAADRCILWLERLQESGREIPRVVIYR